MITKQAALHDRLIMLKACNHILMLKEAELYRIKHAKYNNRIKPYRTKKAFIMNALGVIGGGLTGGTLGYQGGDWLASKLGWNQDGWGARMLRWGGAGLGALAGGAIDGLTGGIASGAGKALTGLMGLRRAGQAAKYIGGAANIGTNLALYGGLTAAGNALSRNAQNTYARRDLDKYRSSTGGPYGNHEQEYANKNFSTGYNPQQSPYAANQQQGPAASSPYASQQPQVRPGFSAASYASNQQQPSQYTPNHTSYAT